MRTRDVLVARLNGTARDPVSGQHKRAVVYSTADVSPMRLAALMRDAADRLDLLERGPLMAQTSETAAAQASGAGTGNGSTMPSPAT